MSKHELGDDIALLQYGKESTECCVCHNPCLRVFRGGTPHQQASYPCCSPECLARILMTPTAEDMQAGVSYSAAERAALHEQMEQQLGRSVTPAPPIEQARMQNRNDWYPQADALLSKGEKQRREQEMYSNKRNKKR